MANPIQLQLISSDVDAWNGWRKRNPGERVDLSGAPLRGVDLRLANLKGADLGKADSGHGPI